MREILISVFIFAFGVEMYISQDVTTEGYVKSHHPLSDFEPFEMEDFHKKPEFDDPTICHLPNMKCIHKLKITPICVFEKNHGLINFDHICEVYLQNCLAQPKGGDHVYGVANKNDIIYYNRKNKPCYYYIKKAKNLDDAIRLYYKSAHMKEDIDDNKLVEID